MRPNKLIMKAFGPFAKETVIDFDAMGNSIFLISGDTGAGKTSIFDAMVYALYGTASGGGRSGLSTETFHSDYAKNGNRRNEMRVDFTFTNAGRVFTVTRRMFWGKTGSSATANKESYLCENGSTIATGKGVEKRDDVTAKVTELLGLDANQFRQIIMLAQGEFRKFLESGSAERGEILGRLYDNRCHQDFQLRLKAANTEVIGREKELLGSCRSRLGFLILPSGITAEEKEKITAEHPDMMKTVYAILQTMKQETDDLSAKIKKEEQLLSELTDKKVKAETQNQLLDDLDAKRAQEQQLRQRSAEFDTLRGLIDSAVRAERVLPFEAARVTAQSERKKHLLLMQRLEDDRIRLDAEEKKLRSAAEHEKETICPQIDNLTEQQNRTRGILHFYDDLAKSFRVFSIKRADAERLQSAYESRAKAQKRDKALHERLSAELQRLENAGEAAVRHSAQLYSELEKKKVALAGLQESVSAVAVLQNEEVSLAKALQSARESALSAEKEHFTLYSAFVRGQACRLAQDMAEVLKVEPAVTCPVCGSIHTAADVIGFAVSRGTAVPKQEAVDKALAVWNNAKSREQKADSAYQAKHTEIQEKKNSLLNLSAELLGISNWNSLSSDGVIRFAFEKCVAAAAAAGDAYRKAISDKNARDKATREKTALDAKLCEEEQAIEKLKAEANAAAAEAKAAETSVDNWKQQLVGYPETKEEAQRQIDTVLDRVNSLRLRLERAEIAVADCAGEQAKNAGNIAQAKEECARREEAGATALQNEQKAMAQAGFADAQAYQRALSPEGVMLDAAAIVAWTDKMQLQLKKYNEAVLSLHSAVTQLERSTAGLLRVDTQALSASIGEKKAFLTNLRNREKELAGSVQTNEKVYADLVRMQTEYRKYRKVDEKLRPLSDTANGSYAFSRYVLSDFFHRIVEQANTHLESLTDGEYSLIPFESNDKRQSVGLDLRVLNTITGLERETASLSGGQSFEASLALALGLSDVVQMESASTVQIDSMFIDEGFGSLDGMHLDKAINVLQHLSAGKRQIGIISHVARLDECLSKKLRVVAGKNGSSVRIETDA